MKAKLPVYGVWILSGGGFYWQTTGIPLIVIPSAEISNEWIVAKMACTSP